MRSHRLTLVALLALTGAGIALGGCHASGSDVVKRAVYLEPTAATAMTAANVTVAVINALENSVAIAQAQARAQELAPGTQRTRAVELCTRLANGTKRPQDLTAEDKKLLAKLMAATAEPEER